jgi:hypothetical protein
MATIHGHSRGSAGLPPTILSVTLLQWTPHPKSSFIIVKISGYDFGEEPLRLQPFTSVFGGDNVLGAGGDTLEVVGLKVVLTADFLGQQTPM